MTPRDQHLEMLAHLVQKRLGLNLSRGGLAAALETFFIRLGAPEQALESLRGAEDGSPLFQQLVGAVTIQHSWLFRDLQQLEAACSTLHGGERQEPGRRRIWVPACATGEDAYSILALTSATGAEVELLGTDISAQAVESARQARYGPWSIRNVPPEHQSVFESGGDDRRIALKLRRQARFSVHNILQPAPHSGGVEGKWDLIVCRNVLIYLSRDHAALALRRFADALAPGGTLVLGASDILASVPDGLVAAEHKGRIIFRRGSTVASTGSARPIAATGSARPVAATGSARPASSTGSTHQVAPLERDRLASSPATPGAEVAVPASSPPHAPPPQNSSPQNSSPQNSSPQNSSLQKPSVTAPSRPCSVPLPATTPSAAKASPRSEPADDAICRRTHRDAKEPVQLLLDGIACHLAGDLNDALTKLRAALYLQPELWPAAYYLGLTYDALGRCAEARREYAHASRTIEQGAPLPPIDGQDFSFLQRDVAEIARRRAEGGSR